MAKGKKTGKGLTGLIKSIAGPTYLPPAKQVLTSVRIISTVYEPAKDPEANATRLAVAKRKQALEAWAKGDAGTLHAMLNADDDGTAGAELLRLTVLELQVKNQTKGLAAPNDMLSRAAKVRAEDIRKLAYTMYPAGWQKEPYKAAQAVTAALNAAGNKVSVSTVRRALQNK